ILVRGRWYPILKMRWVQGLALNEFIKRGAGKPAVLSALAQIWLRMARELRRAEIAHGDLQHGNVLLVVNSQTGAVGPKLIDYDGMWVPALVQSRSGECGHPAYQHPERLREGSYGPELDRFAHLVIFTAMRCVTWAGRDLWERYDNGDNLLFR